MGTNYYLVDLANRRALDIGKFHALGEAARIAADTPRNMEGQDCPVTRDMLDEAAKGWWTMAWEGHPSRLIDGPFSAGIAARTRTWIDQVAPDAALRIRWRDLPWQEPEEEDPHWPVGCNHRVEPWDLWTLYVHPMTGFSSPPWRLWSPPDIPPPQLGHSWVPAHEVRRWLHVLDDLRGYLRGALPGLDALRAQHRTREDLAEACCERAGGLWRPRRNAEAILAILLDPTTDPRSTLRATLQTRDRTLRGPL